MTTAKVVETSVTVKNNSQDIQDYVNPDDHTQPTYYRQEQQSGHSGLR